MIRWLLVLVGATPMLVALLEWGNVAAPLVSALDAWFGFHCHRDPTRSFGLFGQRLGVCARCGGIYLGLLLGAMVPPNRVPQRVVVGVAVVGTALLLLDVGTEMMGWRVPSIGTRFVLGLALALPATALAIGDRAVKRDPTAGRA